MAVNDYRDLYPHDGSPWKAPPFEPAPSTPYPANQPIPAPMQGLHLAIAIASDDSNTLQDMLKELRHRLQPVLRELEPIPVNQSSDTEKKPMSPMAQEIRGVSSSLEVSKYIINDILARLEV